MYLRAIKTKYYSHGVPIVGTVDYNAGSYWDCLCFQQLSGFQNLRLKGGNWPPSLAAKGPATPLLIGFYENGQLSTFHKLSQPLSLANPPWVGAMSTDDGFGHRCGRNGEFCAGLKNPG